MITATVNLWEIFIGGWYTCVFYSYALGRDFVATQVAWNVYLSNTGFRNFNLILRRLHFRFMICLVFFTLHSSLQFSIPSYITHKTELLVQGLTLVGLFFFLVVFNQCFTILFAFKTVVGKYCVTLELKQRNLLSADVESTKDSSPLIGSVSFWHLYPLLFCP